MERRDISTNNNAKIILNAETKAKVPDVFENALQKGGQTDDRRLHALRDLGNQLQIKAERMRLLARAEEGLEDADYNPYVTQLVAAEPQSKGHRYVSTGMNLFKQALTF